MRFRVLPHLLSLCPSLPLSPSPPPPLFFSLNTRLPSCIAGQYWSEQQPPFSSTVQYLHISSALKFRSWCVCRLALFHWFFLALPFLLFKPFLVCLPMLSDWKESKQTQASIATMTLSLPLSPTFRHASGWVQVKSAKHDLDLSRCDDRNARFRTNGAGTLKFEFSPSSLSR